ncbi:OmpA family protein [Acidithiobacillus sp. HP-6]|jgi:OOP family OmpA-OmpF porin|uniref:OmpA family protein n=1 Tax=unclassified Acidithiobacillus TaxID=2614800 RepID=UPI00187AA37E|nr:MULTISPECIES: OmpA family protein [unclassified Acidithiobacillus]MBE7564101.1 OmpA family protein [Acidithiobacillus sp. HP-6]MBE7570803.1 OmpA family protein [Acidithiobacillus sp. HP-2]MDD2750568.1 OmpA family protein [Acidithiobacillus sp.]MDD5279137.1 OmpA family protein [Acidithiobacillus sp.]
MKKLIALSILALAGCAPYQVYCPLHECNKPAAVPVPVVAPVVRPDIAPVEKRVLVSKPITIQGVNFKVNSAKLLDRDITVLDKVAAFAHKYHSAVLTVNGYCSHTGSFAYNQRLSVRRAESVAHYLEARGVSSSRMIVRGHSYMDPVASNATPQGRFKNQRVEINSTIKVHKLVK